MMDHTYFAKTVLSVSLAYSCIIALLNYNGAPRSDFFVGSTDGSGLLFETPGMTSVSYVFLPRLSMG